jgi:hypothetical protein
MNRLSPRIMALCFLLIPLAAQAGWSPDKRLTWTPGISGPAVIAADSSGVIHVVWQDSTPGNFEIYYKKSLDGGSTWSAAKRLTWTATGSGAPKIGADSKNAIHVVWSDGTGGDSQVYYKRSTDGGATWTSRQRLSWTGKPGYPALAIDSADNLCVVWDESTSGKKGIYFRASTDGGVTWNTTQRLSWTEGNDPAVAAGLTGHLHVVWSEYVSSSDQIFYKKSTDAGITWTTRKRITWSPNDFSYPEIAVDSFDNPHVLWVRLYDSGPPDYWFDYTDIFYKRSTGGGVTWTTSKKIKNEEDGWCMQLPIVVDSSGNPHVLWWSEDNGGIYYKKSTDGGATWVTEKKITSTPGYAQEMPAMAVDSADNLHVVWKDSAPGNYEIYYKKYVK